jgi:hypothetical protein
VLVDDVDADVSFEEVDDAPGIVAALTALKAPRPATAVIAAPTVSRLSVRRAASRARILSSVLSVLPMATSVGATSQPYVGNCCEVPEKLEFIGGYTLERPTRAVGIAPVAQGIEQDGPNVKVGGSIPSGGTI